MASMLSRVVPMLSHAGANLLLQRGAKELPDGRFSWSSDPRLRGTSVHRLTEAQVQAFLQTDFLPNPAGTSHRRLSHRGGADGAAPPGYP